MNQETASQGYGLAKRGAHPVKVLRLGNAYRVVTADLLRLLGLASSQISENPSDSEGERHGLAA
ncbi:hypothetical protein ABZ401_08755 [Streptomyces sp. NPDC005892]|uniref:hypothetical protein n=1 Tax=Streptomyces sp. NPDC005892 TaxID=3155593 RepID=UPI0033E970A0